MKIHFRVFILCVVSSWSCSGFSQQGIEFESVDTLVVKAIDYLTPKQVLHAARIGETRIFVMPIGGTPFSVLQNHCGYLSPTYIALVLATNNMTLVNLYEPVLRNDHTNLAAPACVRSPKISLTKTGTSQSLKTKYAGVINCETHSRLCDLSKFSTTYTQFNDQIDNVLALLIQNTEGEDEPDFFEAMENIFNESTDRYLDWATTELYLNLGEALRDAAELKNMTIDNFMDLLVHDTENELEWPHIDYETSTVVLNSKFKEIKNQIGLQFQEKAIDSLVEGIGPVVHPTFLPVQGKFGILSETATSIDECSGGKVSSIDWPFNYSSLIDILSWNESYAPNPDSAKVMILDSGVDLKFLPEDFVPMEYRLSASPIQTAFSMPGRAQGVNYASRENSARTSENYQNRYHGIAVYGAALGSTQLEGLRKMHTLPIKIFPASIVENSKGEPKIHELDDAIEHATKIGITIINMSFFITDPQSALADAFSNTKGEILMVVAAGNDGRSLDEYQTWPQVFGGKFGNAPPSSVILTVGSHNKSGQILNLSRHGKSTVDILAPGCGIPTYNVQRNTFSKTELSGSSFSAPLVTFVSSLLRGYDLSPLDIKSRLIASAKFIPDLDDKVFARGILDASKALNVFQDVVTVTSDGGEYREYVGFVENRSDTSILFCSNETELGLLKKMSIDTHASGTKVVSFFVENNPGAAERLIRYDLCEVSMVEQFPDLKLRVDRPQHGLTAQELITFKFEQIVDFTPKHF